MKFGISIMQSTENLSDVARLAALADDAGFDLIGLPDSHSIWREAYVASTVAAMNTSRASVGPMVTNPSTRHPTVTASAIASVAELAGGRAFLGIATGNSAVYNIELPPAKLEHLEAAVELIRECLERRSEPEATRLTRLNWGVNVPIPIIVGAAGPRAIAVAARCGDAVVLDIGKDPHLVGKAVELAHEARATGPRADHPFEIWLLGKGYISDDERDARDAVATIMAATANDAFRVAFDWKEVPERLRPALREFHRRYAFSEHASTSGAETDNVLLLRELGLEQFIYDRFALIGAPEDVASQLRALEEIGVAGVSFTGAVRDKPTFIRRLGDEVLPRLDG